jgi:hypothetical protein
LVKWTVIIRSLLRTYNPQARARDWRGGSSHSAAGVGAVAKLRKHSASTCKELSDYRSIEGFFSTSFGRIFCSAKNSGLSGVSNCRHAAITRSQIAQTINN